MKDNKVEKKVISLNLETEIITKIDNLRDGIPRSTYINRILKEAVSK